MVEQGRGGLRLFLGEDLVVGHVHARGPADTMGSSLSPESKGESELRLASLSWKGRREEDPRFQTPLDSEHW